MKISQDLADLLFRALFCFIFVALGSEHIFSDSLIQHLMPEWMPLKRLVSVLCGLWLLGWGSLILLGVYVRLAAQALMLFLVIVTVLVHVPGVCYVPTQIASDDAWMWTVLQRSNLAKNLCLLGVCFHLLHHQVGRFSFGGLLAKRNVS